MVCGGAGGGEIILPTDAILRVIAPAGSTVTISKGAVIKSDGGHENADDNTLYDYYFIIHASQFDSVNPWTVTATLGAQTASTTVIVDAANEYGAILSYGIFLWDNGDECTAITGGWVNGAKATSNYTVTNITKTSSINYSWSSATRQSFGMTTNKITLYNGDVLKAEAQFTGKFSMYVVLTNTTGWYANNRLATYETTDTSITQHDLAITSDMQGYVYVGAFGQSAVPSGSGSISQVKILRN